LYPEEFCDDGNNDDGDGCSALCELEDEYGVTWTCEQVIDSSTYDESTGTVTIVGHTNCYDCTTDDSCTSDDETIITETEVTDPSDTDSSGIYLEISVTIPEEDCTANLETAGGTTEILYMCLDKSVSMTSLTGVC
jgi:cysteine-rich repeat protein